MTARICSTVALWAIISLAVVYGKAPGFCALIIILSALSMREFCAMFEKCGLSPLKGFAHAANLLILASPLALFFARAEYMAAPFAAFGACVFGLCCLSLKDPYGKFWEKSIIPTLSALVFISLLAVWPILISLKYDHTEYTGVLLAIWVIAAAKFTDVGGYAIGCAIGRHKIAPAVSPQKSWEGFFGGLLSSMAVSIAFVWIFGAHLPDSFTPWTAALASLPIGFAGFISDLIESVLKRRAQIKDSGSVIPGIGGALDLQDSILLSAPVGYLMLLIVIY